MLTNCITMGTMTLHTATFAAKFVIKIVKTIIRKIINKLGRYCNSFKRSPIFPFKSEYSFFAASDSANPPPVGYQNIMNNESTFFKLTYFNFIIDVCCLNLNKIKT